MSRKEYGLQKGLKTPAGKTAKIYIGVPGAQWEGDFGMSLITLIAYMQQPVEGFDSIEMGIQNSKGSILPQLRQKLVDGARDAEATHILFVDTDMKFPPYMLAELLKHDKDIVALNCPVKTLPSNPTARYAPTDEHPTGVPVYQQDYMETENPLRKVWRVGTGVMLIKMSVFQDLPYPHFPIRYEPENDIFVGEDWGFCELAEAAGYDIFVDVHMSHMIEHVGSLAFSHGMVTRGHFEDENSTIYVPD